MLTVLQTHRMPSGPASELPWVPYDHLRRWRPLTLTLTLTLPLTLPRPLPLTLTLTLPLTLQ